MRTALIAGGGIAGLASALSLAHTGNEVTVLESANALRTEGAGLQIGPNAVRALTALGAWPYLAPKAVSPDAIQLRCGLTGKTLQSIPLGDEFERRFGAPYRVAHRADLLNALARTCEQIPAISIRTGEEVNAITVEGNTVIAGTRTDEFVAEMLVGADGVHSTVREHLLPGSYARRTGHVMYRACPDLQADTANVVTLWMLPGRHVVTYPVSGGEKLNIIVTAVSQTVMEGWSAPSNATEVAQVLDGMCDDLGYMIEQGTSWQKWSAAEVPEIAHWTNGPLTLAGDAAHASLPFLAQGAAMALEDAVDLGLKIQKAPLGAGLKAYEEARRSRTARHVTAARTQGRIYHLGGPVRLARNLVMRALPASRTLDRLQWLYDWRPVPS